MARPQAALPLGVDKGGAPPYVYSGFGGGYGKTDKNRRFLYSAGFAARERSERQNPKTLGEVALPLHRKAAAAIFVTIS